MLTILATHPRWKPRNVELVLVGFFGGFLVTVVIVFVLLYFSLTTQFHSVVDTLQKIKETEKVRMIQCRQTNLLLKRASGIISNSGFNRAAVVTVTGYTACKEECDSDPNTTASMKNTKPGKTVAVSRDLYKNGWTFGKRVWVEGFGQRTIDDLMNERFTNRMDILFADKQVASKVKAERQVVLLD